MSTDKNLVERLIAQLGLKRAVELPQGEPPKGNSAPSTAQPTPSPNPAGDNAVPVSSVVQQIREKLRSMHMGNIPSGSVSKPKQSPSLPSSMLIGNEHSQCVYYHQSFPHPFAYGEVILADALRFTTWVAQVSTITPDMPEFTPHQALFIDTETTSLCGGTGTVAFLIGIGFFRKDTFHVEQFFMRDYDDEYAVLSALNERIQHFSFLIGYNSKCFDFPLIKTRFRMNRIPFHGETIYHMDLMHIARRFWGKRLSDCSLSTVERYILKEQRFGDVPGELIPRLWLEYVRTGQDQWIPRILEHNRRDILALAGLMAWLAPRVHVPCGQGFEEEHDQCALLKLLMKSKQYLPAIETARHLLQTVTQPYYRSEIWKCLTESLRKVEQYEERVYALHQWAKEDPENLYVLVELAKYYEHQDKNIPLALSFVDQALAIEPNNPQLTRRKERLVRKQSKWDYPID